jgi:replicative DNA helicase
MSRDQIVDRIIAAEANVPLWHLRTGRLRDEVEYELIRNSLDKLSKASIYIDDTASANIIQIRSAARRQQIESGLDLLIVDYLQLIQSRMRTDNMVAAMTEVSRGLKTLARELQVPILAAAQLSRAVEQRDSKIPRLSDLRETGAIEQDADVVLFIYRKDRDKLDLEPEEQNTAEIIIAKHRNGPIGSIQLKFDPEKVSFRSIDKSHATVSI